MNDQETSPSVPRPLAAAAGAGDLAVTKIRELSRRAADRLQTLEADPSGFADRVQERIESRAEGLGSTFRSAGSSVRSGAQLLSDKAMETLTGAFAQAGEAYDSLVRRGETVVGQVRREDVKQLLTGAIRPGSGEKGETPTEAESESGTSTPAGTKSTESATSAKTTKTAKTAKASSSKSAKAATTSKAGKASKSTGTSKQSAGSDE